MKKKNTISHLAKFSQNKETLTEEQNAYILRSRELLLEDCCCCCCASAISILSLLLVLLLVCFESLLMFLSLVALPIIYYLSRELCAVGADVCVLGCRSVCGKHVIERASLLLLRFLVVLFCWCAEMSSGFFSVLP